MTRLSPIWYPSPHNYHRFNIGDKIKHESKDLKYTIRAVFHHNGRFLDYYEMEEHPQGVRLQLAVVAIDDVFTLQNQGVLTNDQNS